MDVIHSNLGLVVVTVGLKHIISERKIPISTRQELEPFLFFLGFGILLTTNTHIAFSCKEKK
jgi:hypothetical protein